MSRNRPTPCAYADCRRIATRRHLQRSDSGRLRTREGDFVVGPVFAVVLASLFLGLLSFWVQEAAALLLVVALGALVLAAVVLLLSYTRR